jgi:hypothetical protein
MQGPEFKPQHCTTITIIYFHNFFNIPNWTSCKNTILSVLMDLPLLSSSYKHNYTPFVICFFHLAYSCQVSSMLQYYQSSTHSCEGWRVVHPSQEWTWEVCATFYLLSHSSVEIWVVSTFRCYK